MARPLGDRIKAWRARCRLTQAAAAQTLGVHEITLCRWENGTVEPRGLYKDHVLLMLRAKSPAPPGTAK